jgi:group I intron endonuclease
MHFGKNNSWEDDLESCPILIGMETQKIYKIINDINPKVYVGQTGKSLVERFERHCSEAIWKNTKRMPIVMAIRKYGREHFAIFLLEELPIGTPQNIVDSKETEWGYKLNTFCPNGYNLKFGNGRRQWSEEVKRKIGNSNRGKKRTDETRRRLSETHIGNRLSPATKQKLSVYWKGTQLSPLARANSIIASQKTYVLISPEGMKTTIINMAKFCRENGYNKGQMCQLVRGKKLSYRGWTI